jgi:hypothetical protein
MTYSKEAHDLLDQTLEVLKTKVDYPYARLLGMLMPNNDLPTSQRMAKKVEEKEVRK